MHMQAENWLHHKSLHVYTRGDGAGANPPHKKCVQHPIVCICFIANHVCVYEHSHSSSVGMSKSAHLHTETTVCMCEQASCYTSSFELTKDMPYLTDMGDR